MSILNKIRGFPEFYEMLEALQLNRDGELDTIEGISKAFGPCFVGFIDIQPDQVRPSQESINKTGNLFAYELQQLFTKLSVLPNDLQSLKAKYDELQKNQANAMSAKKKAEKSRENSEKSEAKLAAVRAKGDPIAISKAEEAFHTAQQKSAEDQSAYEVAQKTYDEYYAKYKVSFIESFCEMLSAAFQTREKACAQFAAYGQDISQAIQNLHEFDDPFITSLEEKLKALQSITVE